MSQKEQNDSIFEDVDNSQQTIRLVKDVKVDDTSDDTREIDVLADFNDEGQTVEEEHPTKSMRVIEVESNNQDDIPFEPTRELKIKRENSYNENDDYKEKVLVNSSEENVGVKKIIIGDETTTLPVYKRPKKDPQIIIRDVFIYILMIAIVSILVILLIKYCNNSKDDKRSIIDMDVSSSTTTKLTSQEPHTETTEPTTKTPGGTETTKTTTSQKKNLQIPSSKTTTKKKTTTKPKPEEKPEEKPTDKPTESTTTSSEPTTEEPEPTTEPTEPTTQNEESTKPSEQG